MSTLIHCDNEACDRTKNIDAPRRLVEQPWIAVEADGIFVSHYHSNQCLAEAFAKFLPAVSA
jgi:hypothetical protein